MKFDQWLYIRESEICVKYAEIYQMQRIHS